MEKGKFKILIVDDSYLNRAILKEILEPTYVILEAEDGEDALNVLSEHLETIDLMILDIIMPKLDGFAVLAHMFNQHWINFLPVIMISSDNSPESIHKAYSFGATDFITRPFDGKVVLQRVMNTITLYSKQRKMRAIINKKIEENKKNSTLMTTILSHIVEFRNGESGPHVINIRHITGLILKELLLNGNIYNIDPSKIPIICEAATLHDIGKISIPDYILNKPGKLTLEEYAIMKSHAAVGAQMLKDLDYFKEEPLVREAYDICLCHHERYDGKGYPNNLVGDEIPITAQAVALADVYDALTADRCYRPGYSHEEAIKMIVNGECGAFNPILIDCLLSIEEKLKELKKETLVSTSDYKSKDIDLDIE